MTKVPPLMLPYKLVSMRMRDEGSLQDASSVPRHTMFMIFMQVRESMQPMRFESVFARDVTACSVILECRFGECYCIDSVLQTTCLSSFLCASVHEGAALEDVPEWGLQKGGGGIRCTGFTSTGTTLPEFHGYPPPPPNSDCCDPMDHSTSVQSTV